MGPREAALAVELLGVKHVLPIHYGTFPILAGTPDQLRAELRTRGLDGVQVHALTPGGSLRSAEGSGAGDVAIAGVSGRAVDAAS
jgi:L-ascorbate metabolism protein UlaG (beta-lactamase superfamily)